MLYDLPSRFHNKPNLTRFKATFAWQSRGGGGGEWARAGNVLRLPKARRFFQCKVNGTSQRKFVLGETWGQKLFSTGREREREREREESSLF